MEIFWICFFAFAAFQLWLAVGYLVIRWIKRIRRRRRLPGLALDNLADQVDNQRRDMIALAELVGYEPAAPWDHPCPRWVKRDPNEPRIRRRKIRRLRRGQE